MKPALNIDTPMWPTSKRTDECSASEAQTPGGTSCSVTLISSSCSELRGEHVDSLYLRGVCEEVAGVLRKSRGDRTREVRLPPFLVGEGVDDRERRGSGLDPQPHDGLRLLLDEWQRSSQEGGELVLFPGPCLEPDDQLP